MEIGHSKVLFWYLISFFSWLWKNCQIKDLQIEILAEFKHTQINTHIEIKTGEKIINI